MHLDTTKGTHHWQTFHSRMYTVPLQTWQLDWITSLWTEGILTVKRDVLIWWFPFHCPALGLLRALSWILFNRNKLWMACLLCWACSKELWERTTICLLNWRPKTALPRRAQPYAWNGTLRHELGQHPQTDALMEHCRVLFLSPFPQLPSFLRNKGLPLGQLFFTLWVFCNFLFLASTLVGEGNVKKELEGRKEGGKELR